MKKKVGIMSMQRITNYGSFLQAYGLKQIIEDLGYDVEFVDYEYERCLNLGKRKKIEKIKKIFNLVKTLKIKKEWNKFKKIYNKYLFKYLKISEQLNIRPSDLDKLVIGSDEVFNCMQDVPVGYSRELFGKNYEKIDVISYAASFGYTTMNMIKEYGISNELHNSLKQFKNISVRDKNSYDIIVDLGLRNPAMHVDPVLISKYDNLQKVDLKDYIIVYTYPGRLNKKEENAIKKFATKHNKTIVSLGFYQSIADINLYVDPLKVFSYFKNADYIITDTFHGTIFSIKTNSKFCTIIRKSNKNKLEDLLTKLKQTDRLISDIQDLEMTYNKTIDYSETNKIIANEREKSIKYLKENLR